MRRIALLALAALASVILVHASIGGRSATPSTRLIIKHARPRHEPRERLVGAFTTYFPCCEPRVVNIRRAAALLDGTVLRPYQTFSMNRALGRRTVDKGFVAAPMISGGAFIDSVGGGISQVATTLYNAAFFAGLRLVAHTPHSIYIDRYPAGREATVSWGGPELEFTNDWPAALTMRVSASTSAIRVRLYSLGFGRRVTSTTGPRYRLVPPTTRYMVSPELSAGTSMVVSLGQAGFSVDYDRDVYRGNVRRSHERFHTEYAPVDRVVEVSSQGDQTG
jgi:vancomycin resistance protein YoaR